MQPNSITKQPLLDQGQLKLGFIIITLVLITPGLIALFTGRYLLGLAVLTAPVLFLFITNLRLAFYLFLLSICVNYTFSIARFSFQPCAMTMEDYILVFQDL